MKEEWLSIRNFDNYMISSKGRVKSLTKNKNIFIGKDSHGYNFVFLYKNGVPHIKKVHRLVGQAFIPNPHDYPEINHKDEVKTHNNVENLEWCTHKYNSNYGTRNYRSNKTRNLNNSLNSQRKIYVYDFRKRILYLVDGLALFSKYFNICLRDASYVVKRKRPKIHSYILIYKDELETNDFQNRLNIINNLVSIKKNIIVDSTIKVESLTEASELSNVSRSQISLVLNGHKSSVKGHSFKYQKWFYEPLEFKVISKRNY